MEFRLLGATEVLDTGGVLELPSGRARALLAILTLQAGKPVAADRLVDELWAGTPPPTAPTVVQGLVSRLRRALEPGKQGREWVLETVGRGYRLDVDPDMVDVIRFERILLQARGAAATTRTHLLASALGLWRGPALADFTYEPFAQRTIRVLEEARIQAAEDLVDCHLEFGRGAEVIPTLRELIDAHPLRERLHGLLMIALYRSGRQAEALSTFGMVRDLLLEELGVEPGPALRSLHAAILRQDASLESKVAEEFQRVQRPTMLTRERRRVTVAVVDVAPGADGVADAETLARAGSEAAGLAAQALERHGGRVERSLGDELIAFFGFPNSHEDDALRAVRAVSDVRTVVQSCEAHPGVRQRTQAGIETGDIVIAGPGGALPDLVTGPVISTARRLAMAAKDGAILIGPATLPLVRGAAVVKPVQADGGWLVLEMTTSPLAEPSAHDAPMIARGPEMSWLRAAFRRTVHIGAAVRVTVVGDAGVGKSRLAREVVTSLVPDAHAITIRCKPFDEPVGFYPVRQAVVQAAGIHGWRGLHGLLENGAHGVDQVAGSIGLRCPPATAVELAPAMLRLLDVLARQEPVVVILDDLHWADPAFLELIDRLEGMSSAVLLVGLRRPDVAGDSPASERADLLQLGPLSDGDVARLVIEKGGPLTPGGLGRIVSLAQGNPLYAEQLLAAGEEGGLDAIPTSLIGLLSMRLDRLGPGEHDVLRCAAVGGNEVDAESLCDLLPDDARPFVGRHLEALVRKRLLNRMPDGTLRFAHALLRMAAYQSVTLEDRARLRNAFEARAARQLQGQGGPGPRAHLRP